MRVLFVTHNIPRHSGDAAGSFVLRLAIALQADGVRVDVIAPGGAGLAEFDHVAGIAIHRVRYASDANMTLAYSGTMAEAVRSSWKARWALLGLLRATRRATHQAIRAATLAGDPYDVLHVHWWFPSGLALWGMAMRPPVVLTMHGSDVRLAQNSWAARALMNAVLRRVAARTAVSSWLAKIASAATGGQHVHVAPMPVDILQFDDARTGTNSAPRAGVLFVGRLNRQKGLADLLHALAHPAMTDVVLTVAGDGPDVGTLKSVAHTLGVAPRVRWLGVQTADALASLYRAAVVVAMPSSDEGLGLVAVEAQLCRTPVVAYASGGLPDVVRPQEGGTLVPTGDIDALAIALRQCIEHPDAAATRGRCARDAVLERFAPATVAAQYRSLYAEAMHGP